MPKCSNCRKADALETRWEKIRYWFAIHLFPQDFIDARANSHMQGFGEGYTMGTEHQREKTKETFHELFEKDQDKDTKLSPQITLSDLPS